MSAEDRERVDSSLGVAGWPTGLPPEQPAAVAVAAEPRDPDTPAWWDGENTNEFLAEQGVQLG